MKALAIAGLLIAAATGPASAAELIYRNTYSQPGRATYTGSSGAVYYQVPSYLPSRHKGTTIMDEKGNYYQCSSYGTCNRF